MALSAHGGGAIPRDRLAGLRGRSVLIATAGQAPAALAMLELDGIARRILLCPPGFDARHAPEILAAGEVDAVIADGALGFAAPETIRVDPGCAPLPAAADPPARDAATEWVLFTSGTTGPPKLVVHTLASLIGPLADGMADQDRAVWSTFYDIRRYGGLQILLRALVGGGSMVLSRADEPIHDFLARAAASGVTHISGTPSHWRLALMSGAAAGFLPGYVRLSGEIADQAVLDSLRHAFPRAEVAHAFASTEAGVGFDVRDGRAGFPASLLAAGGDTRLRVVEETLRLHGPRTAERFLGPGMPALRDAEGFVDTGDVVAEFGDRWHFMGRREGIINVGGRKVHPEEVEAVLNLHPGVEISRVHTRHSPITGALVAADFVVRPELARQPALLARLIEELRGACQAQLAAHKVPVSFRAVPHLAIGPAGKLARTHG